MPVTFDRVFVQSAGYFMPGEPVANAQMDAYIAPLNRLSTRIQRRILAENGIQQRYYAIDTEGRTVFSNAPMAAHAVRDCLQRGGRLLSDVSLLATDSVSMGGAASSPCTMLAKPGISVSPPELPVASSETSESRRPARCRQSRTAWAAIWALLKTVRPSVSIA